MLQLIVVSLDAHPLMSCPTLRESVSVTCVLSSCRAEMLAYALLPGDRAVLLYEEEEEVK